jgi:hypothetical protein
MIGRPVAIAVLGDATVGSVFSAPAVTLIMEDVAKMEGAVDRWRGGYVAPIPESPQHPGDNVDHVRPWVHDE